MSAEKPHIDLCLFQSHFEAFVAFAVSIVLLAGRSNYTRIRADRSGKPRFESGFRRNGASLVQNGQDGRPGMANETLRGLVPCSYI